MYAATHPSALTAHTAPHTPHQALLTTPHALPRRYVVMLNLLIAIMSNTFSVVEEASVSPAPAPAPKNTPHTATRYSHYPLLNAHDLRLIVHDSLHSTHHSHASCF